MYLVASSTLFAWFVQRRADSGHHGREWRLGHRFPVSTRSAYNMSIVHIHCYSRIDQMENKQTKSPCITYHRYRLHQEFRTRLLQPKTSGFQMSLSSSAWLWSRCTSGWSQARLPNTRRSKGEMEMSEEWPCFVFSMTRTFARSSKKELWLTWMPVNSLLYIGTGGASISGIIGLVARVFVVGFSISSRSL